MIYAIVIALLVGAAGGWYGGQRYVQADWDAEKVARANAEAMVQALSDKNIDDLEKAERDGKVLYDKGKADGLAAGKRVSGRVQSELTRFPVFQNPACVLPPQSLAMYVASINGVRTGVVLPPEDPAVVAPVTPAVTVPPTTGVRPPKPVPRKKVP